MPLVPVLVQMERWGVNVDPSILRELGASMAASIAALRERAHAEAGEDFNLDSPKQLGAILFEKLKLPSARRTRTGYSTDATVLQDIKEMHPLPSIMLEYRELAKLKSTYLDALPQLIASDRHIHTSYHQTVAATGRLSSSDPNLQNIPVRTEMGRRIRTAFIPDPAAFEEGEAVFLSADYSQIELRLLAHLSGDEGLIEAFVGGEDFHSSTAARVFGVPVDEVTPQLRSRAKAVNFGIVYGQQAYGLAQSLGVGFQEAQEMISRYFRAYPRVRCYLDETVEQAREQGWVETLYGRKRHIREIRSGNANTRGFGERTAMNHPMQGSAADIIKLAMIEVARRLSAEGLRSQMVLQVHDELDFNCARSEVERLSALVKEAMEGIAQLKVPLVADVSVGPNWAEAH
jgi:DNA polymerase-1